AGLSHQLIPSFPNVPRTQQGPTCTMDSGILDEQVNDWVDKTLSQMPVPWQFSVGGHLSPWPTYTSGQTILQNRKPCSDDYGKRASWQQHPLGIAKPKYLEQLENYLRKELLLLDLGTDSTQELRLQSTKGRRFRPWSP
uniref:Uncharacterized protein n=1 Tax=Castor canadensis TaxID=51338 RepID=A0A8C0VUL6_CASCN